ncbi:hypothetical protein JAAARDRAFT_177273 [Jaapia argillacea MUCL 33604]|uniref:SEP domain-containing protein n=1 Tax=Jaapia argillacea MUCL 33604 TaxID=933084 RepID=A0A067PTR6_9AGAM|nr:hypothetical protein JAAARDRAFT_177273 [Jaapia argillacea MUCL 33604]
MTNSEDAQLGILARGEHTLGSNEAQSSCIPVSNIEQIPEPANEIAAIRHITFWRDGFNIGDGELMRYDDPANAQILSEIHSGSAPPRILNVLPGQLIELRVANRLSEDTTRLPSQIPPPRMRGPAEPPSAAGTNSSHLAVPTSTSVTEKEAEGVQTKLKVDQTKETMGEQVWLDGGTRMIPTMNLTNMVTDIRNFFNVCVSSLPNPSLFWTLLNTPPTPAKLQP